MPTHKGKRGYKRNEEEFIHRKRAYHIYLENRDKYPLPWGAYEVHHIDFDKTNNKVDNLQILTPTEHDKVHKEKTRNFQGNNCVKCGKFAYETQGGYCATCRKW